MNIRYSEHMGKKKRAERKEAKKAKAEAQRQHAEQAALRRQKWQRLAIAWPIVTVAACVGLHFGIGHNAVTGFTGLLGVAIWVPMILGFVGSGVQPRDNTRAGSIDFGARR